VSRESTRFVTRRVDLTVVGAGWAGLAAAITGCQAGLCVLLLEAAPQAGGRARRQTLDLGFGPIEVDNGQHLLIGAYHDTLGLMAAIGLDPAAMLERRPLSLQDSAGLALRAARLPAPLHLASAILAARGLSLGERVAMLQLMFWLRLRRWQVPAGSTVQALLARCAQPASLCRRLWEPLCLSALNTHADEACAATFAMVLRDSLGARREASDFLLPRQTLGHCLPEPALAWLHRQGGEVMLRSPVRSIGRGPGKGCDWTVDGPAFRIESRRLVLACGPAGAARLLSGLAAQYPGALEAASELSGLRASAIATTWLAWPRREASRLHDPLMLTASAGEPRLADWLFDRGEQRGYRIGALVTSHAEAVDALRDRPDALLFARRVCSSHGLPSPSHARLVTERRATFVCEPSRPVPAQPPGGTLPGLWLAGDFTEARYPATIESAVRSGVRAAQQATRSIS
jgi:squalene-associated FAD-dependent desaturase